MTDKLRKILTDIDFPNRCNVLFSKHAHRKFPFGRVDLTKVQEIIERLGYVYNYYRRGRFIKVDDVQPNVSLNVSTDFGIVKLVLDTMIDSQGDGGPFDYMCTSLVSDSNVKAPGFENYEELEEILTEGLRIYEDIKEGILNIPEPNELP